MSGYRAVSRGPRMVPDPALVDLVRHQHQYRPPGNNRNQLRDAAQEQRGDSAAGGDQHDCVLYERGVPMSQSHANQLNPPMAAK